MSFDDYLCAGIAGGMLVFVPYSMVGGTNAGAALVLWAAVTLVIAAVWRSKDQRDGS